MKSPRDKYLNDAAYKRLVDVLICEIHDCHFTPSEIREAAILASIIYEERNPFVYQRQMEINFKVENALKIMRDWIESSNKAFNRNCSADASQSG